MVNGSILYFNPFRTAVPFWGQSTIISSTLSPNRDYGSKGVKGCEKKSRCWTKSLIAIDVRWFDKKTRWHTRSWYNFFWLLTAVYPVRTVALANRAGEILVEQSVTYSGIRQIQRRYVCKYHYECMRQYSINSCRERYHLSQAPTFFCYLPFRAMCPDTHIYIYR